MSIPVVFERITTQLSIYHEEKLLSQKVAILYFDEIFNSISINIKVTIMDITEARKNVKMKDHIPNIESILLKAPIKLER